jgi:hypothetical protein
VRLYCEQCDELIRCLHLGWRMQRLLQQCLRWRVPLVAALCMPYSTRREPQWQFWAMAGLNSSADP